MRKTLVHDVPTRLFHWIFAAMFVTAYSIANIADDESLIFVYHMVAGLVLVGLVGFRLIWGIVGSRYARFSSFQLKPKHLLLYFYSFFSGSKLTQLQHNPASSYAALLMMGLGLGLGFTGIQMGLGNQVHFYKEIHEVLANSFLFVVLAHIVGIVIHSLRYRDQVGLSMVDGYKTSVESEKGISKPYWGTAAIFVILLVLWGHYLLKQLDVTTRTLTLFGTTLHLTEQEDGPSEHPSHSKINNLDIDDTELVD